MVCRLAEHSSRSNFRSAACFLTFCLDQLPPGPLAGACKGKANHRGTFHASIHVTSDSMSLAKVRKMVKSQIWVWEVHSMYLSNSVRVV